MKRSISVITNLVQSVKITERKGFSHKIQLKHTVVILQFSFLVNVIEYIIMNYLKCITVCL